MSTDFAAGGALGAVLLEGPALLERAVGYTRISLGLLPGAAPNAPTPCSDWDLTRLLRHMDDSLAAFTEAAETGYVAPAGPPEPEPALLAASLRDRACRLLGAWAHQSGRARVSVFGHDVSGSLVAATGALEIAVHGWDVARACGVDRPLPEELAATLLAIAPLVVDPADRPRRFAPPYAVPPTATASERLLAFLGRR
ncbi:TIGR03086 family metal-binding protein [Nocardioides iriomotensis]|uniref:TIGR03086 family protein n=1 Tax=Nocardioides iriomotensis TaxID=715784 RepID=A0A4Q5IY59_9ACTN|nr:TIGR03086 family metal-binding protein [Nocardioides iriomotensis]RYU10168.1 TIGR03086 family protein [Nocardioides iriomotensis]